MFNLIRRYADWHKAWTDGMKRGQEAKQKPYKIENGIFNFRRNFAAPAGSIELAVPRRKPLSTGKSTLLFAAEIAFMGHGVELGHTDVGSFTNAQKWAEGINTELAEYKQKETVK